MISLNKEASDWIFIGQSGSPVLGSMLMNSSRQKITRYAFDQLFGRLFSAPPQDSKPGEIDLHGLYVKEAIEHTDRALQEAKQKGDSELHLIVGACTSIFSSWKPRGQLQAGKGLHSQGGAAKIKPAIEELYVRISLLVISH